jgi:SOS-response transcriptional repressor LexA
MKLKKAESKNINDIIDRISALLKQTGMTKSELGRRTGVSRSAVGKMLKKKNKSLGIEKLQRIASAFNIEPALLQYGNLRGNDMENILQKNKTSAIEKNLSILDYNSLVREYPTDILLLYLHEAHEWRKIMQSATADISRKTIAMHVRGNPDCFGVLVENDVMYPEFKKDDALIVDPHKNPVSNNFVVVRLLETNENILRQYVTDGSKIHLIPLNSLYDKITTSSDKIKILGVVICKNYG